MEEGKTRELKGFWLRSFGFREESTFICTIQVAELLGLSARKLEPESAKNQGTDQDYEPLR